MNPAFARNDENRSETNQCWIQIQQKKKKTVSDLIFIKTFYFIYVYDSFQYEEDWIQWHG